VLINLLWRTWDADLPDSWVSVLAVSGSSPTSGLGVNHWLVARSPGRANSHQGGGSPAGAAPARRPGGGLQVGDVAADPC
jgi:hypothetical protein